MALAIVAEAIESVILQMLTLGRKSCSMAVKAILQKLRQTLPCERATGIFEKVTAYIRIEANDLEKIAIAIAGDGRNAHTGNHLAQPFFHGSAVTDHPIGFQARGLFRCQIREHGAGTSRN